MGVDTEINAKPAQAEAGVGAGAELGKNKGFPFSVYSTLYQACVCSISQYGAEVYGFKQYDGAFKLHLRAARAFLGLPKNVASFGLVSELD